MKRITKAVVGFTTAAALVVGGVVAVQDSTDVGSGEAADHYTVKVGETYRIIAVKLGIGERALACANRTSVTSCPSVTSVLPTDRIIHVPVTETTPTTVLPTTASTTTPAPTTAPASTTVVPSTVVATTTAPAPTTTVPSGGTAGCGLVTAAFCDTFDAAAGNPATRAGDLNPVIWGVSRTGTQVNFGAQLHNEWLPATMQGCGTPQLVLPPNDVRICDGQLHTAVQDGGGQPILALYPKQPFDIAGRTGKATFDVSADAFGQHSAWPEWWWTDQPIPAPGALVPAQEPYARNSVGFIIANDTCPTGQTGIYKFLITRNYQLTEVPTSNVACVTKGTSAAMNHFEVRVSEARIEVWATDAGQTALKLISFADVAMPLTRGVIWIEQAHYNACKDVLPVKQCDHTFHWDNVGFDGPTPYRDLTFDVQDANVPKANGRVALGYLLDATGPLSTAVPVYWEQTPTQAYVGFNFWNNIAAIPTVRVNGGPWHTMVWPFAGGGGSWRTIGIPIPMSEIRTGMNVIEFQRGFEILVSNINIILINAAPVT